MIGSCRANLPPGIPAGLTWASETDICITTDTGSVLSLYRWSGDIIPSGTDLLWSPDGQLLAVREDLDSGPTFVTGSGEVLDRGLPEPPWYTERDVGDCVSGCPKLSPDGSRVAEYNMFAGAGLMIGAPDASPDVRVATASGENLSWSPDGEWLTFAEDPSSWREVGRVFVIRFDGSLLTEVAVDAGCPVWRP